MYDDYIAKGKVLIDKYLSLQHHGILGQKWGVRRYQNKDGSLTNEGKERYKSYDSTVEQKRAKLAKDFPALNDKTFKNIPDDLIGEFYWLMEAENELDVSPKEFKNRFPKTWSDLDKEIRTKSGDWYNSKGITKEFQENRDKHRKLMEQYHIYRDGAYTWPKNGGKFGKSKDYEKNMKICDDIMNRAEKLNDEMCGIVLNDLGYEDTPRNRNWIKPVVIWD